MIRLAALALLLASPAAAQNIRVDSGEHDGFTRLVLHIPPQADWAVNRTTSGYELRLNTPSRFDLSDAFRRIGRQRVAGLEISPQNGRLQMQIDCACHAAPFLYRAGILVVDIKDGIAPAGSPAEFATDGRLMPRLTSGNRPLPRPAPPTLQGYNWVENRATEWAGTPLAPTLPPPAPDDTATPDLLRRALLQQLGQGAELGLVEMTEPRPLPEVETLATTSPQIRIDTERSLISGAAPPALSARGEACPAPDSLALRDWISDAPMAEQVGPAMADLVGEFDRPDPVAITRAVRFQLAAGFGAEARATLQALAIPHPDRPLWISISHIMDGTADQAPAFADLAACNNAAALWAVLGDPDLKIGEAVNDIAVLQAFSDLPPLLRQSLGPSLARRFLSLGMPEAAETVQATVHRPAQDSSPAVMLMDADLSIASGQLAEATALTAKAAEETGPAMALALAAHIEALARQNLPVAQDQVTAVEALLRDRRGGEEEAPLQRALALAHAGAGDFDNAFRAARDAPETEPMIWQQLATMGSDDALLATAIPRGPSLATLQVNRVVAERLIALGLGKSALPWIAALPEEDIYLEARALLAETDARGALRALAGADDAQSEALRAEAQVLLGDDAGAAETYGRIGAAEAAFSAQARGMEWGTLQSEPDSAWGRAAALVLPTPDTPPAPDATGPLAEARGLIGESAAARSAIDALLIAVPTGN